MWADLNTVKFFFILEIYKFLFSSHVSKNADLRGKRISSNGSQRAKKTYGELRKHPKLADLPIIQNMLVHCKNYNL